MRPPGQIHQALLDAARQGPGTLRELAQRSQVGWQAARETVPYMARSGKLRVVGEAHVQYRNRLVQVYEVAAPEPVAVAVAAPQAVTDVAVDVAVGVHLQVMLLDWAR